jgi:hypothetical protein
MPVYPGAFSKQAPHPQNSRHADPGTTNHDTMINLSYVALGLDLV